ncbi:MAG TPA: hypothetical protein DCR21_05980 [Succinivibrionaceae bacterium]|nr:hypothetical protein [Succinivibrionaceae bacterium]
MKIIITGGTGFIGSELALLLNNSGHDVIVLTRNKHSKKADIFPDSIKILDYQDRLPEADAIVHLAGASIATLPLFDFRLKTIASSRTDLLKLIEDSYQGRAFPKLIIQASGTSVYEERQNAGEEDARTADNFYSTLCHQIEISARDLAARHDCRCFIARIGVVIGSKGGLSKICSYLPKLRLFPDTESLPYIKLSDCTNALKFILENQDKISGNVLNLTSPECLTANGVLSLCRHLPYLPAIPVPKIVLNLDKRGSLLSFDSRIKPDALMKAGFCFSCK